MLGALGFALYRGVTLPWVRIVMLFGVLHLSLSQVRHADLLGLLRLLDEYSIRITLLAPSTPAVALLDRLPDWRRAYADEIAVVHTRR